MTRYAYATVAIVHAEACMTSGRAYFIRTPFMCAAQQHVRLSSPDLSEPGRDPPLAMSKFALKCLTVKYMCIHEKFSWWGQTSQ